MILLASHFDAMLMFGDALIEACHLKFEIYTYFFIRLKKNNLLSQLG